MDPDEALAEIRATIKIIQLMPAPANAHRLGILVSQLDSHIAGGGKLPESWTSVAPHVDPDEIVIVDKLPDTLGGARVHWEPLPPALDRDKETGVCRVAGAVAGPRRDHVTELIRVADTLHGIASDLFATDAGAPQYRAQDEAAQAYDETYRSRKSPDPDTFQPQRGDEIEAWIRDARNRHYEPGPNHAREWTALDDLLDDYRLHADLGSPLSQPVSEHGVPEHTVTAYQPHPENVTVAAVKLWLRDTGRDVPEDGPERGAEPRKRAKGSGVR